MKKIISMLLVCTMLLLSSVTVFAVDTETEAVSYDLSELFADYQDYTLSEMVEFINANKKIHSFVQYFRDAAVEFNISYPENLFFINAQIEGNINSSERHEIFGINCDINFSKYLYSTARITTPSDSVNQGRILLGERGNKLITVELNKEFVKYVCSLDRVEGNRLIVKFFMNMFKQKEVVGVTWFYNGFFYPDDWDTSDWISPPRVVESGDCNGDFLVNGADGYMIKKAILGFDDGIDPLAVDMNYDGLLNAKDSLEVKKKIVLG